MKYVKVLALLLTAYVATIYGCVTLGFDWNVTFFVMLGVGAILGSIYPPL